MDYSIKEKKKTMPYILPENREIINSELTDFVPIDGGELQYAIAVMIQRYYKLVEAEEGGVRYKHMEAINGALVGAINEHYRCVVVPYEDGKIEENGGVYNVGHGGKY